MIEGNKEAQPKPKLVPVFISRSQAPKGAFKLTEKEILSIQHRRLEKSKTSEKYAFRFGPHVAGGTTAVTACLVNAHFRTKFLLFDYGLLLSYAPVVIVPTILTLLLNEYITNKVLLQPECMGCLEVRSGVIQVASSLLYASIIAPISSIALSKKYHTYLIRNNFQPGVRHALKTTPFHRFSFMALMVHNFLLELGLDTGKAKNLIKLFLRNQKGGLGSYSKLYGIELEMCICKVNLRKLESLIVLLGFNKIMKSEIMLGTSYTYAQSYGSVIT